MNKTMDFIRRHKGGPFYVDLWPQDTHTPHTPDPELLPKYPGTPKEHQNFNAVLDEYDRQIGRLLDFLKAEGLDEQTMVVFTADNGPESSFQRQRSGGLRGMKWSLYEGGVREPFIVRWPGRVPAGQTDTATISVAVDLFPSICSLVGVPAPGAFEFDGRDMSAAWLGRPQVRSAPLFWEYGRNAHFLFPKEPDAKSPNVALRDGQWKLLLNADGSETQLYDLAADPKETTNVAEQHPEVAKRLSEQALKWRKSLP